jgi:hypothetical protein
MAHTGDRHWSAFILVSPIGAVVVGKPVVEIRLGCHASFEDIGHECVFQTTGSIIAADLTAFKAWVLRLK